MKHFRSGLALFACAFAPMLFTGCASDAPQARPIRSEVLAEDAAALNADLAALSVRVRAADESLAQVVTILSLDPKDKLAKFRSAITDIGGATAMERGATLRASGARVVAAQVVFGTPGGAGEARRNFEAVDSALRGADTALAYHAAVLRDASAALGAKPNAAVLQRVREKVPAARAAGEKVAGWLEYAVKMSSAAARTPVPDVPELGESAISSPPAPVEPAEHETVPSPVVVTPAAPVVEVTPAPPAAPKHDEPSAVDPIPLPVEN